MKIMVSQTMANLLTGISLDIYLSLYTLPNTKWPFEIYHLSNLVDCKPNVEKFHIWIVIHFHTRIFHSRSRCRCQESLCDSMDAAHLHKKRNHFLTFSEKISRKEHTSLWNLILCHLPENSENRDFTASLCQPSLS